MGQGSPKVGQLTYHRAVNMGATWQAYALLQALESVCGEGNVETIDYRSARGERYERARILNTRPPFYNHAFMLSLLQTRRFVGARFPLSANSLTTDSLEAARRFVDQKYDAILVGSDQIWLISPETPGPPFPNIFWLDPRLSCRKIAFAASANLTDLEAVSAEQWARAGECLAAFDLIGVRDDVTLELVERTGRVDPGVVHKVPDPTFLADLPAVDPRPVMERRGIDLRRPVLGLSVADKRIRREVTAAFRARGFQVANLAGWDWKIPYTLTGHLDVEEWACVYRYLTLTITDRFHGTIFAMKNGCPFVTVDHFRQYRRHKSKTATLLEEVGLAGHRVDLLRTGIESIVERADAVLEDWDPEACLEKVEKVRQRGIDFLERVAQVVREAAAA